MYTITNTSTKIIHISSTVLMPDASMEAPESVAKLPSIQAFVKRGMLKIFTPAEANGAASVTVGSAEEIAQSDNTAPDDGSNEDEAEQSTAAEEPKTPADKPSRTSRSPRNSAKTAE